MFTHLHTHTEFSLLDGLSRIPALMDRAKDIGQEAIAITDHGGAHSQPGHGNANPACGRAADSHAYGAASATHANSDDRTERPGVPEHRCDGVESLVAAERDPGPRRDGAVVVDRFSAAS